LAYLGLSEDYQARTGRPMYTVESHIRYLAEAKRGDVIEAESLLVSADAKRMRLHTLLRRGDGVPVATGEYFYLHVDQAAGEVTAMPPDRWRAGDGPASAPPPPDRPPPLRRGVRGARGGRAAAGVAGAAWRASASGAAGRPHRPGTGRSSRSPCRRASRPGWRRSRPSGAPPGRTGRRPARPAAAAGRPRAA